MVFIRNCGASLRYTEEVSIITVESNQGQQQQVVPMLTPPPPPQNAEPSQVTWSNWMYTFLSKTPKATTKIMHKPPTAPQRPKESPPPIPTQRVTQPTIQEVAPSETTPQSFQSTQTIPQIEMTQVYQVTQSSEQTEQTIQLIPAEPTSPGITTCPLPPNVPDQPLPPPEKVIPPPLRPISHSDAQESVTNAPVGPGVPEFPTDFPFSGSLKNVSKPADYYGDDARYYRYTPGDECLKPGIFPASHFRPDINSGTDNCSPSSACMEFKMPPVRDIYQRPEDVYNNQTNVGRSYCCFPKGPKKGKVPLNIPICTGIILNTKLVLTSATCVVNAQAAFDRLSNLQVKQTLRFY